MSFTRITIIVGGIAAGVIAAPVAAAQPDLCTGSGVAGTVSSVTGSAQRYLADHPGAGQVLSAAMHQSPAQAAADVRGYFTANPQEYYELRGVLAPIGDVQRECNVAVLPPALAAAYSEFMAG